jgi:hypothetical protein
VVEREERERGIGLNDFQWFFWIWYLSALQMKTPNSREATLVLEKKKHR